MERWTMEDLNSTDDLGFAIAILNERRRPLNPYSPLSKKLAETVQTLADIKEERDRMMLRIAQKGPDRARTEPPAPEEEKDAEYEN